MTGLDDRLHAAGRDRHSIEVKALSIALRTLAAAFLIGVCAMWISEILFEVIARKFRPIPEE